MNAILLAVMLTSGTPVTESFEGTLELKLTGNQTNGSIALHVSKLGLRSDVVVQVLGRPLLAGMVARAADPNVGFGLDPVRKQWQPFDLAAVSEAVREPVSRKFEVEKLPDAKVLDYRCKHVKVRDGAGLVAEYWISPGLVNDPVTRHLINQSAKQPASVEAALHDAGVEGVVLKMSQTQADGSSLAMELMRAVPGAQPASEFEVPADYAPVPQVLGGKVTLAALAHFNSLEEGDRKALIAAMQENLNASKGRH